MTQLSGTIRLSVGSETVAVASIGGELAGALMSYGYNPRDFNYLRWPVGASRWGEGALLLIGADLAAVGGQLANGPASLTLISEVGTVTISDLRLGPPVPLLVPNRGSTGSGLYRVPIYDARWEAHTRVGGLDYNLTESDDATLSGDEIVTDLLTIAGLPVTLRANSEWVPYDVRSRAAPAMQWVDRVLHESGRVYVYGINGGGTVEFADQRRSLDLMADLNPYVITGGVRFAETDQTGHYVDVAPDAAWVNQRIPRSVGVVFRNTEDGEPVNELASYAASDAGDRWA